ncbi:apical endosomal glycoprotein-like [Narcine bancroftii]|uniref:apical endosomal glycoprotein-like n=1 Tax=Narcine bancroftii TaxID=1343680 RepID=UPI003831D129
MIDHSFLSIYIINIESKSLKTITDPVAPFGVVSLLKKTCLSSSYFLMLSFVFSESYGIGCPRPLCVTWNWMPMTSLGYMELDLVIGTSGCLRLKELGSDWRYTGECRCWNLKLSAFCWRTSADLAASVGEKERSSQTISCNFEVDICEWEVIGTLCPLWTRDSGKDPNITNFGPIYDHTINERGYYLCVCPASSRNETTARLSSILQTATASNQCFSFWYHMYGPKIGSLSLKVKQEGQREELLWTRTATQGNEWRHGFQTVTPQLKHFRLIFEGRQTLGDGDIAIDDISVVGGACEPQRMCNFEANACEFTSTGLQTWQREQGYFSENISNISKPAMDNTKETWQGYYMLANTSQRTLARGQAMQLVSASQPPRDIACLYFWVQANVENSGTLNVYVEEDLQEKRLVWNMVITPLLTWKLGRVRIHTTQNWKLLFEAVGGGADLSYIAIDDVMLELTQCSMIGACDFEDGLCGWRNVLDPEKDNVDWNWSSGKAPSRFTAPSHDHTLGTWEGHYMFVDIQAISAGNTAWLLSEHLPPTKGSCLTFHYYTKLNKQLDHGSLKVFRYISNKDFSLWESNDLSTKEWRLVNITVESTVVFQVGFKVIKSDEGETGYIAIDDIKYRRGVNCQGVRTDKEVSGVTNTPGIVAAVILVLALVVCLALGTNYWLKNRSICFHGRLDGPRSLFGFDNISYRNRNKDMVTVDTPDPQ